MTLSTKYFAILLALPFLASASLVALVAADPAPHWKLVQKSAAFAPRDSSGHVTFQGRKWLVGGWVDPDKPTLRDVWSAQTGDDWTLVTQGTPFRYSDYPMLVAHDDAMYMYGGWADGRLPTHGVTNSVWRSRDGKHWDQVTPAAQWSPRMGGGAVSFQGRLWLLGGREGVSEKQTTKNDVWSSRDGKTWQLVTADAPWSPRAFLRSVVHDGRIWVIGGGDYQPPRTVAHNDVWSSADGIEWRREPDAPWGPRIWFSLLSESGYLWVLGGYSKEFGNFGDVWVSRNGHDWFELCFGSIWTERHAQAAWVGDGKITIAAGHARPLNNEVWSLDSSSWQLRYSLLRGEILSRLPIPIARCT